MQHNDIIIEHYISRARSYANMELFDEAISDCTTALELYKAAAKPKGSHLRYAMMVNYRGNFYCHQQKYAQALEDYTCAIVINPKHAFPYANRGHVYFLLGDYKNMIIDLTKSLALSPIGLNSMCTGIYNNRGTAYYFLGNYAKAILDFSKSIVLDPKDPVAYVNRGKVYRLLGENPKAILDYNAALLLYSMISGEVPEDLLATRNELVKMQAPVLVSRVSVRTNSIFNAKPTANGEGNHMHLSRGERVGHERTGEVYRIPARRHLSR